MSFHANQQTLSLLDRSGIQYHNKKVGKNIEKNTTTTNKKTVIYRIDEASLHSEYQ